MPFLKHYWRLTGLHFPQIHLFNHYICSFRILKEYYIPAVKNAEKLPKKMPTLLFRCLILFLRKSAPIGISCLLNLSNHFPVVYGRIHVRSIIIRTSSYRRWAQRYDIQASLPYMPHPYAPMSASASARQVLRSSHRNNESL